MVTPMASVTILVLYTAFIGIVFGEDIVEIEPPGSLTGGSEGVDFGEVGGTGFFATVANAVISVAEGIFGVAADTIDVLWGILNIVFDIIPLFLRVLAVDLPIELPVLARIPLVVIVNLCTFHIVWYVASMIRGR